MAERPRTPFWRATALVIGKDLRIERRSMERLSSMLVFALILLVVEGFAFDVSTVRELGEERALPALLWLTFSFAGLVGFSRSFQPERDDNAILALLLAPVDRGAVFLGKALANLLLLWSVEAAVAVLAAVIFDFDLFAVALPLAAVVAWHTVGLAALGTLFAALSTRVGRGEALLGTLLLPAATPLFLSAIRCTETVIARTPLSGVLHWLALVSLLNLLYILLSLILFEFLLEV